MLKAGFDLQKWVKILIRKKIYFLGIIVLQRNDDCTFLESQIKLVEKDLKRILEEEWDRPNEEFVFHFSSLIDLARSLETTKRNLLKISASFYDPLGIISPVPA